MFGMFDNCSPLLCDDDMLMASTVIATLLKDDFSLRAITAYLHL